LSAKSPESQIYDTERHEVLDAEAWSAERVRSAIARIVEDFESALRPDGSWPAHPLDFPDPKPAWSAYAGAAGAVCALRVLRDSGYAVSDPSWLLDRIHAAYLERPDYGYGSGLQLGEIGILTPAVLADPDDPKRADRLHDAMLRTIGHPAREITSGETGMLHAALTLFRETGDERWSELYRRGAESLWQAWSLREGTGEWLWMNDIFGQVRSYYGACHGIAGNAQALLRGADLLPAGRSEEVVERTATTLASGALRSDAGISWPVSADASGQRRLLQWCHGAPGVVAALAHPSRIDTPASAQLDDLLEAAGELVWTAGPLVKGSGLCHGTAGNGYAFLGLHARMHETRWLDRARLFAMHAIAQCDRARERYGQGRYTLWTGDGGLAVYLHHCIRPRSTAFPGLELF